MSKNTYGSADWLTGYFWIHGLSEPKITEMGRIFVCIKLTYFEPTLWCQWPQKGCAPFWFTKSNWGEVLRGRNQSGHSVRKQREERSICLLLACLPTMPVANPVATVGLEAGNATMTDKESSTIRMVGTEESSDTQHTRLSICNKLLASQKQ